MSWALRQCLWPRLFPDLISHLQSQRCSPPCPDFLLGLAGGPWRLWGQRLRQVVEGPLLPIILLFLSDPPPQIEGGPNGCGTCLRATLSLVLVARKQPPTPTEGSTPSCWESHNPSPPPPVVATPHP